MSSEEYGHGESGQSDFKLNFVRIGFLVIILLSFLFSIGSYFFLRHYNLYSAVELNSQRLIENVSPTLTSDSLLTVDDQVVELANSIKLITNADGIVIVNNKGKRVWSSGNKKAIDLNVIEPSVLSFIPLDYFKRTRVSVFDQKVFTLSFWLNILTSDYPLLTQHIEIVDSKGKEIAYARLAVDMHSSLLSALLVTVAILFVLMFTGLLFLYFLYKKFVKIMATIEDQENKLNNSVRNLSNLLKVNQKMQSDIRTASAHAVELNEQFLRRVGADLHDGPAQMIG